MMPLFIVYSVVGRKLGCVCLAVGGGGLLVLGGLAASGILGGSDRRVLQHFSTVQFWVLNKTYTSWHDRSSSTEKGRKHY